MARFKLNKFLREYLIIGILIALALIQPIGALIMNQKMITVGQAIGISPVPWAFTGNGDYENFVLQYNVTLYTEEKVYSFPIDRDFAKNLKGPHTNKVFYYNLFSYYPQRVGNPLYDEAFDQVVCKDKSFFSGLAEGEKIVAVKLVAYSKEKRWVINHVCL